MVSVALSGVVVSDPANPVSDIDTDVDLILQNFVDSLKSPIGVAAW